MSRRIVCVIIYLILALTTSIMSLTFRIQPVVQRNLLSTISKGRIFNGSKLMMSSTTAKEIAVKAINENDVMVFSKTYCPYWYVYSHMTNGILIQFDVPFQHQS